MTAASLAAKRFHRATMATRVSNAKLPEVMIEVLVSQGGPFLRSHRPEEAVRMLRTFLGAILGEMLDTSLQALSRSVLKFRSSLTMEFLSVGMLRQIGS
jgi:hypothetical protein